MNKNMFRRRRKHEQKPEMIITTLELCPGDLFKWQIESSHGIIFIKGLCLWNVNNLLDQQRTSRRIGALIYDTNYYGFYAGYRELYFSRSCNIMI